MEEIIKNVIAQWGAIGMLLVIGGLYIRYQWKKDQKRTIADADRQSKLEMKLDTIQTEYEAKIESIYENQLESKDDLLKRHIEVLEQNNKVISEIGKTLKAFNTTLLKINA
jgi:hypothetical protein